MPHDVFISYSTRDQAVVDQIYSYLGEQGVSCWLAPRAILPGADFSEEIARGLEGARVLLLVFSSNSNESPWVRLEVIQAVSRGIRILPLRIDSCAPSKAMSFLLSASQWLDATAPPAERYFGMMLQRVQELMSGPPPSPPLPFERPPLPAELPRPSGFVGRGSELAYFAEQLHNSGLALITGMAGVGKSSLAAMLASGHAENHSTFWHSFRRGEDGDTIVWKLAGFLYWQGHEDLWRKLQSGRSAGVPPPSPDVYLDYLVPTLSDLACILCFDDFQNVEDNSFITLLVKRLLETRLSGKLLLVLTARHVPPFLHHVHSEPLAGLSQADALVLVRSRAADLRPDLAERLCARTDGVPEFIQLALSALARCVSPQELIEDLEQAPNVAGYLLDQVERCLSPEERQTMIAVAVLAEPATRDAIEAAMAQKHAAAVAALEQGHLLKSKGFRHDKEYWQHPLLQAYFEEPPSRKERREIHLRAASFYEEEEPNPIRAAWHYAEGRQPQRAAEVASANGWQIITQGSAGKLRRLLEQVEEAQLDELLRARVHITLGQALGFAREVDSARKRFEQGLAALDSCTASEDVSLLRARACRGIAGLLRSSEPDAAMGWIRRGLDELAAYESPTQESRTLTPASRTEMRREGAALRIDAGWINVYRNEAYEEAREYLNAGLALLGGEPDPLRAAALINLGVADCIQGRVEEGKRHYREGMVIAEKCGDLWRVANARHDLAIEMETAGDWAEAAKEYEEARALADRLGNRETLTGLTGSLGILRTKQCQYEEADKLLTDGVAMARAYALDLHLAGALSSLADLRIRQGRPEDAPALLAEAEAKALEMEAEYLLPEICRNRALAQLAESDADAASTEVERSLEWARKLESELDEGLGLRAKGQILVAAGRLEEALEAFEGSLALLDGQDPYEVGRTKAQWALALLSGTNDAKGRTMLDEANAEFERLGAGCEIVVYSLNEPPAETGKTM